MWIAIQNAVGARQGVGGGPTPLPYTPPLDDFTGAIAAFSVRKLSSSYSGFCCQVTRVSDSATLDVPFTSSGLIDIDAINTFDDGGGVDLTIWYDQTSSGNDFSGSVDISTVEEKPGLNGTASVGLSNSGLTIPSDFTLVTLTSYQNNNIYFGGGTNTFFNYATTGNDTNLRYRILGNTRDFTVNTRSGTEINVGTLTSGALKLRHQGNIYTTSNYSGSFVIDFLANFPLYHQEYIIYNSSLTEPQTLSLTQNLNSYYQVTNLPDYTSGFLADYSGAAAAYSVRKLSNTAIKCMRVRRAVAPFDEKDIGFTAGGDLDEAAIVAFGGSDSLTVSAWYDQSGQSNHATQITPGSQPQIYNGTAVITENGKPAISWSSNEMDWTISGNANSFSVFTVATNDATSGNQMQYTLSSSPRWWHWYLSGNKTFYYDNTTINHSSVDTNQHLFAKIAGSTLGHAGYWVDNVKASTTGTLNSSAFNTDQRLGNYSSGTNNYWDGTMQELVMWPTDQSSNRTGIETNINDYFEIIVNDEAATSGFLFDYPNAAVAYSVRQLNNNAEFAMQVERSDGRRKNIGFDSNGDLDTQAIIDFSGGNAVRVNRFYDQTGAQNHSVELATATNNIFIYDGTSIITENGMPMARYSLTSTGSSKVISIANNPLPQGLTHSVYAVGQRPSAPSSLNIFRGDGTPTITALYQERAGNLTYGPGWTAFGIYTYPLITNAQRLYAYIRKNGTDGECFNDGVSRGTTSAMTATTQVRLTGWDMQKSGTGLEEDCSGLQELIYYNDDRTSVGDNTNILSNIKSYFSIP